MSCVSGRGVVQSPGQSNQLGPPRGSLGPCGHATLQHGEHPAPRFQRRQRGRPRTRGLSGLPGRGSGLPSRGSLTIHGSLTGRGPLTSRLLTGRGVPCESTQPCDNAEPQDPVDLFDGFESSDGASAGGSVQRGSVTPRDDASSRRSSISTECSEVEDKTAFLLAAVNRGQSKIRGNILWKYRGRGRGWLSKNVERGKLHAPRGLGHSRGRGQGRGRGRGRGRLSTTAVTLQSLQGECPCVNKLVLDVCKCIPSQALGYICLFLHAYRAEME